VFPVRYEPDTYILRRRNSFSKGLSYAAIGDLCVSHTVPDSAYRISCIQESDYTVVVSDAPNASNTSASNAYARNVAEQRSHGNREAETD
jgi:hypothetical protein